MWITRRPTGEGMWTAVGTPQSRRFVGTRCRKNSTAERLKPECGAKPAELRGPQRAIADGKASDHDRSGDAAVGRAVDRRRGEQRVDDGPRDAVGPGLHEQRLLDRVGRRPLARRQREERVAVEERVHRLERPREAVVTDAGHLLALGLRQRGVGRDDPDRRRQAGAAGVRGQRLGPGPRLLELCGTRPPHVGQLVPETQPDGIRQPGGRVDGRADGVDGDERGDGGARREHDARRADAALEAARPSLPCPAPTQPCATAEADALAYAALPSSARGRWPHAPPRPRSKRIADGTIGTTCPGSPIGQPIPSSSSASIDTVGGGEAEGGPAAEDDGMDPVDEVAGVEQVGLPRAGATAAHVDAGDRTAARARARR